MAMGIAKILVVDDDEIVLESCRRILEPEGLELRLVPSVDKAVEIMKREGFDLLLVDVKMPERDGISFLQEVKNKWPKTPFVVMSGYPIPETIADGMKLGAAGFIAKPFTPDELLGSVPPMV
jgi:DNA-binding NtrC family response regulator